MRKLIVFNNVSVDGYFVDAAGGMTWAHRNDPEWNEFVAGNASGGGMLLFGRKTYDLMVQYWPTPLAAQNAPVVAKQMNALPKIVFSRSMSSATWNNTQVVQGDLVAELRRMKQEPGPGMAMFGSGTIVAQLALHGVIDEYQLAVIPIVLGRGRTLFEGLQKPLPLKLNKSRTFANGNVFLVYEPIA